jgi:5-methylcytosine-specific restriction enzyme A
MPQPGSWGRGSTRASRALRARDPVCRCPGCPNCTADGCARPSTEDDHVVPVMQGGTDDESNHAGKCGPCHLQKSQREAAAARHALSVRRPTERHPGLL